MCDGRPLASPLFRRLAGRGAFFCGFLFRWILHFVFHLIRGVALHESSSCSKGDSLVDCGRPCDPLSCLVFTALWLRCSQTILMQETQSAKDVDFTCSITFLFRDAACLPVEPMSLDRPVNPFGRSESSRPSLPPDAPSDGLRRVASFPRVCVVLLGTPGALLDLFSPNKRTESSNSNIAKDSLTPTTFLCLHEVHGKDEYLQAIQVLAPRFRVLVFFPENENAGGSAICIHKDLLPEEAIVTHLIICQGRVHLVNIQSGRHSLVFVNVHFELELTLRQLRGRLGLVHPHWPAFPMEWALFWVTSTSVTPKKDDLLSGTRHSQMATRERLPCSTHFSIRP